MNLYEHTIIARQDVSPTQLKQIEDKYSKIVEKLDGNIVRLENWGLMNLTYLIKKNKKGKQTNKQTKNGSKQMWSEGSCPEHNPAENAPAAKTITFKSRTTYFF